MISEKEVQEFEENCKKQIFEKIYIMIEQLNNIFDGIDTCGEEIGLEIDGRLPNIAITLNNKIVELSRKFEEGGISIYSEKIEDYGSLNLNFVSQSFVGMAIMSDLLDYINKGQEILGDITTIMENVTSRNEKKLTIIKEMNVFQIFFQRLKGFLSGIDFEEEMYCTDKEICDINKKFDDFSDVDDKIWNYNLKNNLAQSIVKYIREQDLATSDIEGILEETVIPQLNALGLINLLPQIKQELNINNKKDSLVREDEELSR